MKKKIILNDDQLDTTLDRLACQLTENHEDFKETILVGLQPRGKSLCEKLVNILRDKYNINSVNHGFLDITFFRDDFRRNKDILLPNKTHFKLLVENKKVVFIDDVLYTGRTIRAALDELNSFGRPSKIQLAVLVDRGHREVPIKADFIGANIPTHEGEHVKVELEEIDENDSVSLINYKDIK